MFRKNKQDPPRAPHVELNPFNEHRVTEAADEIQEEAKQAKEQLEEEEQTEEQQKEEEEKDEQQKDEEEKEEENAEHSEARGAEIPGEIPFLPSPSSSKEEVAETQVVQDVIQAVQVAVDAVLPKNVDARTRRSFTEGKVKELLEPAVLESSGALVVESKISSKSTLERRSKRQGDLRVSLEPSIISPAELKRLKVVSAANKARERVVLYGLDKYTKEDKRSGLLALLERKFSERNCVKRLNDYYDQRKDHFLLWMSALKAIEGRFGSSVMINFAFLRWIFLLNVALSILWIVAIVIPFIIKPPKSFSWHAFKASNLKKPGALDNSWIFYGGYSYELGEQKGWYRVDYMYPLAIAAMLFITLIGVLGKISSRIMGNGDITVPYKSAIYPFSTIVFASWDFRITSMEASSKLRRAIRMQLREMLADRAELEQESMKISKLLKFKRGAALFILWPLELAGTVSVVVALIAYQQSIEEKLSFLKGFAQPILLTAVNSLAPQLVRVVVAMEEWRPATAEKVVFLKLYIIRMVNVGTLFFRLYVTLQRSRQAMRGKVNETCTTSCMDDLVCCKYALALSGTSPTCTPSQVNFCVAGCADTVIAKTILRIILVTTISNNGYQITKGLIRYYYLRKKMEPIIEDLAIDIVYVQALVWVGSLFSPVAAVLGAIYNLVTFYSLNMVLMKCCQPMQKAYSASRTSNVTYGILLLTLIISSMPMMYRMTAETFGICGPKSASSSMYETIENYIKKAPNVLWLILQWISNPLVLSGVIIILIFLVFILRAMLVQSQKAAENTNKELDLQRLESRQRLLIHTGKSGHHQLVQAAPRNKRSQDSSGIKLA